MPRYTDLRSKNLYTIQQLIEKSLNHFKFELDKKQRKNAAAKLQRILEKRKILPVKNANQKNNVKYYRFTKDIEKIIFGKPMIKYYREKFDKNLFAQSDKDVEHFLFRRNFSAFKKRRETNFELLEKLELTPEEGNILEADRFTDQEYLRLDELEYLGKKGLVLRESLTDDEKEKLELYNIHQRQLEFDEQRIEELFYQKKLEIMITTLFNKRFVLNEKKLREDIATWVYSGKAEHDLIVYETGEKAGKRYVALNKKYEESAEIDKIYLRLNNSRYFEYYVDEKDDYIDENKDYENDE